VGGKGLAGITVVAYNDASGIRSQQARAVTDAEGRYRLTGFGSGQYTVSVIAPTYAQQTNPVARDGKPVTLAEAETAEGIDFQLVTGGVITGKVTDTGGQPVVAERVTLTTFDAQGRKQRVFLSSSFLLQQTDDRGIFRVFGLPAGRYLVSVGQDMNAGMVRMGFGGGVYQRTFHPDATDETRAVVIELAEGGEKSGIDIVVGTPEKTFIASGFIIDGDTGKPVPNVRYGYGTIRTPPPAPAGSTAPAPPPTPSVFGISGNVSGPNGEFVIEGLQRGRYVTFASADAQSNLYSDNTLFEITDGNVSGLEIRVRRGATISGVAVIEGSTDPAATGRLAQFSVLVSGQPGELGPTRLSSSRIQPDGAFHITGVRPGKARIHTISTPRSKELALVRVERDGVAQPDGFEVNSGENVTGVRLVFSQALSSIRGLIKIEGGELPKGASVMVLGRAVNNPGEILPINARADERGRFLIEAVPPGEYELSFILVGGGVPVPPQRHSVTVLPGSQADVTFTLNIGAPREKQQ
jgi:hypothetical protein